jgi:predicted GTPase
MTCTVTKMEKHLSRKRLLESFESLQTQFDSSLATAKSYEQDFEDTRQKFMQRLSTHLADARKNLPDSNPLKPQVLGFIELMEKTKAEWNTKIAGREKGVKFRKGFEDSLLVFVNGKVKSGKSSLGNYMAWGHTDPDAESKRQVAPGLVPNYFSHEKTDVNGGDTENEALLRREFRVGATEATSSIQGFKLPGLTWVDSPGLHSVKVENEKLARDYVEHADLILYTLKSDSPGRESDLDEIKQLLGKEKKVLLLLTGSDDIEEDYDDEADCLVQTVVMKDTQRREKQRTYVRQALENICSTDNVGNIEIVSFSARYAQLNADDSAAFSESGMGLLCETLHRIAQSDGVRIKQRTPLANMRTFLQSCHDGLRPYSDLVSSFKQPLEDLKHQSDKKLNTHIRSGQAELNAHIDAFFDHLSSLRNDELQVGRELTAFQESLSEKYKKVASDKLGQIFEDIMVGFQSAVKRAYSSSDLVKLPEFKLEKVEEQITIVQSGTKKRNSLFGMLAGGVAGFLLGGPAGAALGASLGGGAGGATGRSASVNYRSIELTVGDNLQEIRQQAIRSSEKMLEEQMRKSAGLLWSSMDRDIEQLLGKLRHEIADFESHLGRMLRATENT